VDTNATQVIGDWINSLAGTPALTPPTIAPNGGTFTPSATVTVTSPDTNAAFYYTVDGSTPTTNSARYLAPLYLTTNLTLTVNAAASGYATSVASSALFSITPAIHFTSGSFLTNGIFQLGFYGLSGQTYVLSGSTNLQNWTPLTTNFATTNQFFLTDPNASNFPQRFYRAHQQ
jgi:hypothetical protein